MKNTGNAQPVTKKEETTAERYLNKYALTHQDPVNKVIHYICVPLLMFSLFGLIWAVPFPHLKFLGSYNGYFNWASFAIALAVYYYLRISPLVSYTMLFVLMGFSYLILQLQGWQAAGGPAMWLICIIIFIPALCIILLGNKREKSFPESGFNLKLLPLAPVSILYKILKRARINN